MTKLVDSDDRKRGALELDRVAWCKVQIVGCARPEHDLVRGRSRRPAFEEPRTPGNQNLRPDPEHHTVSVGATFPIGGCGGCHPLEGACQVGGTMLCKEAPRTFPFLILRRDFDGA